MLTIFLLCFARCSSCWLLFKLQQTDAVCSAIPTTLRWHTGNMFSLLLFWGRRREGRARGKLLTKLRQRAHMPAAASSMFHIRYSFVCNSLFSSCFVFNVQNEMKYLQPELKMATAAVAMPKQNYEIHPKLHREAERRRGSGRGWAKLKILCTRSIFRCNCGRGSFYFMHRLRAQDPEPRHNETGRINGMLFLNIKQN